MAHKLEFKPVETLNWMFFEDVQDAAKADFPIITAEKVADFFALNDVSSQSLGVRLSPDSIVEDLRSQLDAIGLIEVDFPAYTDGRGYSQARILREHMGFQGELCAIGDVLIDQLRYMKRCGFDTAVLAEHVDPSDAQAALERYGVWYQPAADENPPAHRLRRFVPTWEI